MQFDDDNDINESANNMKTAKRARRKLDIYLQMDITKFISSSNSSDNPLVFWKEQEHIIPYMAKLAKQIFCIPASSAGVERAFSSAGVIISVRRNSISPFTVNNIILIRSDGAYPKTETET